MWNIGDIYRVNVKCIWIDDAFIKLVETLEVRGISIKHMPKICIQ